MEFNQEAINSFKKIINDELAYDIFIYDWAIRKEIENHISVQLFESPYSMILTLLKILKFYIERSKTKSIIGFTEDDPALTSIGTWASQETKLPFYSYNMEDAGAQNQFVRPGVCPCSLLIPYSTNDIQVNDIIKIFTEKMVPITQVISLVEEHQLKMDSLDIGIEYLSVANWHSIQERIISFKNVMPEKMAKMLSIFK
ncbi:MAG: hypothetical protein HY222_08745 [Thaumarchaeota archaeon]|nr:hypothetical protein [Nitrososphaerota archaeon]MBI3642459.1 hypothetical protein [Nitrososphaerota archaeon]